MKETVDPQIIEQLDPIARKYKEAVNNNDARGNGSPHLSSPFQKKGNFGI